MRIGLFVMLLLLAVFTAEATQAPSMVSFGQAPPTLEDEIHEYRNMVTASLVISGISMNVSVATVVIFFLGAFTPGYLLAVIAIAVISLFWMMIVWDRSQTIIIQNRLMIVWDLSRCIRLLAESSDEYAGSEAEKTYLQAKKRMRWSWFMTFFPFGIPLLLAGILGLYLLLFVDF